MVKLFVQEGGIPFVILCAAVVIDLDELYL